MNISVIAVIIGMVYILAGLGLALGGGFVQRALGRFPRSQPAGIALAAMAMGWTAIILWNSPLGWFEPYRQWLPWLAVIIYLATVLLVDDLLAPRALGGLLLLVGAPVLDVIRWEPTSWRLALTVQAYIWVVAGMVLVFSPFRFRRLCEWIYKTGRRPVWAGAGVVGLGMIILGLTVTVFRDLHL